MNGKTKNRCNSDEYDWLSFFLVKSSSLAYVAPKPNLACLFIFFSNVAQKTLLKLKFGKVIFDANVCHGNLNSYKGQNILQF